MHIDHDHVTAALGNFEDDPARMLAAIDYLSLTRTSGADVPRGAANVPKMSLDFSTFSVTCHRCHRRLPRSDAFSHQNPTRVQHRCNSVPASETSLKTCSADFPNDGRGRN